MAIMGQNNKVKYHNMVLGQIKMKKSRNPKLVKDVKKIITKTQVYNFK